MSSIEFRKDLFADERDDNLNEIGKPTIRQDIRGHVTARSPFFDDHLFDGLLHLRCVRSPHHHARIRSVDTSAAERMPGVRRVILPKDVPNNLNTLLSLIGFGKDDEALLQGNKVAYRGEAVAAIVADTERQARDAVAAVKVDYEVLAHILDVEEALKPNAPTVNDTWPNNTFDYHDMYDHQKLRFGDVEAGFAAADHIIEGEYQMSPIEQAPMETCGAIAAPEINDRYVCYTSTQALFFSLGTTAKLLDLPSSRLHFIGGTVGGGFGGKVDSLHEPLAVLGAMLTGAPVKYTFDRAEEMQVGAPRGAERWRLKDGVMNDGTIVARQFTGFFDSGAYTRLSSYAIQKSTGHLPGPYSIPNVASNIYCVYTNRTPATAMRGFGITGVDFAIECHMDKVAETVAMNPIDLRIKNAYRDGDMKAHRRLAKNTALIECCQVAAQKAGWSIGDEVSVQSSLVGGAGVKAQIPETVIDDVGKIGERQRTTIPLDPSATSGQRRTLPAGTQGVPIEAAPPQRDDMLIEPSRLGHRPGTAGPVTTPQSQTIAPVAPPRPSPAHAPPPVASPPPQAPSQSAFATPSGERQQTAPPQASPTPSNDQPAPAAQPEPYKPSEPFQRGVRRPGASPFISGTRRR
ncbi:MAG: molybdopterin-dependent oxidoreductase [Hyphomicrobiaceae bacterium]